MESHYANVAYISGSIALHPNRIRLNAWIKWRFNLVNISAHIIRHFCSSTDLFMYGMTKSIGENKSEKSNESAENSFLNNIKLKAVFIFLNGMTTVKIVFKFRNYSKWICVLCRPCMQLILIHARSDSWVYLSVMLIISFDRRNLSNKFNDDDSDAGNFVRTKTK